MFACWFMSLFHGSLVETVADGCSSRVHVTYRLFEDTGGSEGVLEAYEGYATPHTAWGRHPRLRISNAAHLQDFQGNLGLP